jgi:hypothetical protein
VSEDIIKIDLMKELNLNLTESESNLIAVCYEEDNVPCGAIEGGVCFSS